MPPTVRVGDIFARSWGYDQTNINFYQVVKVSKTGQTVSLRPIAAAPTDDSHVVPVRGKFLTSAACARCGNYHAGETGWDGHAYTDVYRRRVQPGWKGEAYLRWNSYSGATLWNGQPAYQTPAGFGH